MAEVSGVRRITIAARQAVPVFRLLLRGAGGAALVIGPIFVDAGAALRMPNLPTPPNFIAVILFRGGMRYLASQEEGIAISLSGP
jgi:hypothetical protein